MSETTWTLWIIEATNGKYGKIVHVYAKDEQHARERARYWLEAYSHLPQIHCKAYPNGFQFFRRWLPGSICIGNEL